MSTSSANEPVFEKPCNGLAGLKHWRYDAVAGLLVSLTSLPLSLGIAIASGAPPIAGLFSAIIAGLILPFLGGSFVTISGPAAGLAPALLIAMTTLGHGNLAAGYPRLLAVICLVGTLQIVLSLLGAARLSLAFPAAVVEGMLASIGLMIIAKQLPNFVGHPFRAHGFFDTMAEVPSQLGLLNAKVFPVGMACLVALFVLGRVKARWARFLPPPLAAVILGTILGQVVGLDARFLIHVPDHPLAHGIVLPDFAGLLADRSLVAVVVTTVLTLVMIDGVESLATIAAVDKIDPFRRKSDPDRTLLAMGVLNICSSIAGGLTIIPGGVKSKVCVVGGGRTLWANFYNACFLIGYLFIARALINLIPLTALAAILIYTGYRMSEPALWRHVARIGPEQLLLFAATVAVTLATDLLWGILAGMAVKLVLNLILAVRHGRAPRADRPADLPTAVQDGLAQLRRLFGNPVTRRERVGGRYLLYFNRPLVCFNAPHLDRELRQIPDDATDVILQIGDRVPLIDHTTCDNLMHFVEEYRRTGRGQIEMVGLDRMQRRSEAETSMRLAPEPGPRPAAVPTGE